ncbi:MAG: glyoxylate/hydroxypyruvate reductase A [Geminicoccaceae bacterium]|nr:glyoxylate/hydroxypyruvate reductase A [Geminicoccaceae bacterium]
MALLWYSTDDDVSAWSAALRDEIDDLDLRIWPDLGDERDIDMALVWLPPPGLLAGLPNLEAIFSLGAGIDAMLADPTLPAHLPLCRMVDPSLAGYMSEYVLTVALTYHRHMHLYAEQQARGEWRLHLPVPAASRRIGVMGLGELGRHVAATLSGHGFRVRGWSRSGKRLEGVETFAGDDERGAFLAGCDMLVCLLPLTAETENILDADLFAAMPDGSFLVHAGRGRQLVEADLVEALRSGKLAAATIDVFPIEPLPADHPLWRHPRVTVTPHAASYAQAASGAAFVADNIRRLRRGDPLLAVVDRERGY